MFTSDPFTAPSEISFWLAGHNGVPGKPDQRKNRVRLVEAGDGTLIYEAFPPRNDVARLVRWDTSAIKGQKVRIECVDGDAGNAYAWLAIGNFQPSWILGLEPARALERACRWVSRLGLTSMEDRLRGYLKADSLSRSLRIEVADAVASLQNRPAAAVLLQFLRGSRMGEDLDRQVISACIDGTEDNLLQAAKSLTRDLTSTEQRAFALGWVQRGADVESLLRMTREGWLAAGSLADPEVMQTLTPRLTSSQREQLESLTANIDANSDQRQRLAQLLQSLPTENLDLKNGHQVFKKNCAACHQLRGEGVVVGPQLDGAAVRSPERLLEDIVTPDHNVDRAFRTTSFLLEDGRVQVGLVQNETEQQITLVDSAGKQITLDADAIERRQAAGRSLMPGNFGELISAKEFADMLAYIRGQ